MDEIAIPILADDPSKIPTYATKGAAGADVRAFLSSPLTLHPGRSALIPTGLKMEIPSGYEIQVRPRSGLALKHGITVLNTPGTIDSDYRGELQIILINHGKEPFEVLPDMKVAQIILAPVFQARFIPVDSLATTARGANGFGHSGCQ